MHAHIHAEEYKGENSESCYGWNEDTPTIESITLSKYGEVDPEAKNIYDGRIDGIYDPIPAIPHPTKVIIAFVHPHEKLRNEMNPKEHPKKSGTVLAEVVHS